MSTAHAPTASNSARLSDAVATMRSLPTRAPALGSTPPRARRMCTRSRQTGSTDHEADRALHTVCGRTRSPVCSPGARPPASPKLTNAAAPSARRRSASDLARSALPPLNATVTSCPRKQPASARKPATAATVMPASCRLTSPRRRDGRSWPSGSDSGRAPTAGNTRCSRGSVGKTRAETRPRCTAPRPIWRPDAGRAADSRCRARPPSLSTSPAAIKPSSAQAVCDGVLATISSLRSAQ